MVAFITSLLLGLLGCLAVHLYGKRRSVDAPLSWGQAMAGAFFVFLLFVVWYGIVPHQWMDWADNDLGWRADEYLVESSGSPLEGKWPLDVNMRALRDIVAVNIYGVAMVLHVVMWMQWQNRGKERPAAPEPTSQYGRPLVRKG